MQIWVHFCSSILPAAQEARNGREQACLFPTKCHFGDEIASPPPHKAMVARMHTLWYIYTVKPFAWDEEKSALLKHSRGVSFEEVVFHIFNGDLVAKLDHPNPKYAGQQIFVVRIGNYAYAIPFVEDEEKYFLKTIIPSRKLTRDYLKKEAP